MSESEYSPIIPMRRRYPQIEEDALQSGPRKKPCHTDPLIHHGRHFGRVEHALCNLRTLLRNGIHRLSHFQPLDESAHGQLSDNESREHRVFLAMLGMIPGLQTRLLTSSDEEVRIIADLIQKGVSSARSDDTKSLKSVIIDWISPPGQPLIPPLARNIKTDRGFNHDRTGFLLCPAGLDWTDPETREGLRSGRLHASGDQWPIFLYDNYSYDPDDPWNGLLRSAIIVSAYKHIFTSPSSVGKEPRATRSGNARIHGMTRVTRASIAYVVTQVRFSLSSSSVFSKTDTVTDSERFYSSILDLLEDPDEEREVGYLLEWWDRMIFPAHVPVMLLHNQHSVLAKIRAKRAAARIADVLIGGV